MRGASDLPMTKVLIDAEFDKRKLDSFRQAFTKSRRIREGILFNQCFWRAVMIERIQES